MRPSLSSLYKGSAVGPSEWEDAEDGLGWVKKRRALVNALLSEKNKAMGATISYLPPPIPRPRVNESLCSLI